MLLVGELLGAEQGAACLVFPFFAQMMIVALVCCVESCFADLEGHCGVG